LATPVGKQGMNNSYHNTREAEKYRHICAQSPSRFAQRTITCSNRIDEPPSNTCRPEKRHKPQRDIC
jgi:hypothetical protein